MKLAALISGGKDSLYACYLASKKHNIEYLVSMIPESSESYMFHYPNVKLTELQAKAMEKDIVFGVTKGEKEKELEDLKNVLKELNVDGIVTGALASNYQKKRIDNICKELGIKHIAPLWGIDPKEEWLSILKLGFEVIITQFACEGLDETWLGRKVDFNAFRELEKLASKYKFHLGFEGGEAETFVLYMPLFKKKIEVVKAKKIVEAYRGFYIIEEACLREV